MSHGPGKYDDEATAAREATGAAAVVLIVLGGRKGEGFAVQATSPALVAKLPALLRSMAEQIDADLANTHSES